MQGDVRQSAMRGEGVEMSVYAAEDVTLSASEWSKLYKTEIPRGTPSVPLKETEFPHLGYASVRNDRPSLSTPSEKCILPVRQPVVQYVNMRAFCEGSVCFILYSMRDMLKR
ncbi:MAG: hypothetical protein A2Y73_06765 [Chloroflexi bacterium RBG_13_56_8]|nr:MAG: hypothetical protein A2Y73_06765 [Chloroflexi bacterium RBG_13_56_8]